MGRTRIAQALIRDLKEKKENSQKRKSELIGYLKRLNQAHFNEKLSAAEYVETLHKKNDGRNINEWVDYYENYSKNCEREIKKQKKEIVKSKIPIFFLSILLISFFVYLSISTSFFHVNFTGFLVGEQREQQFSQDINLTLNKSINYNWELENFGQLTSLKVNGLIEGEGEVKIYLGNLLILDSSNTENKQSKLTGQIIEENPPVGPVENTNNSYSEKEAPSKEESSPSQGELLTENNQTITETVPNENTTQENSSNQSYSEEQTQPDQPGSEATNESGALPKEESSPSQEEPQPSEQNVTEIQNETITSIKKFTEVCTDTCNLTSLNLNESSYTLRIEITNAKLQLNTIDYTVIPKETLQEINNTNITETNTSLTENVTINTTQYQAVLGQPVKWKKQISLNESGSTVVELPKEAGNIVVNKIIESYSEKEAPSKEESSPSQGELLTENSSIKEKANADIETKIKPYEESIQKQKTSKITGNVISGGTSSLSDIPQEITQVTINDNATNYEIEYETPAPYAIEENLSNGKRVKIVGPESIHYEDILSFTKLNENLNIRDPSQIKIYWIENNTYIPPTKVEDTNNNGIYDYIEWVVPHLSNQTFDIIVITKAEHLDSDKNFISDIYEQVKSLDNIWSETIQENDYIRVTFEKNLTNTNDITLFPRIVSGNPTIEVYEKDKIEKIAEFNPVKSNEYNKIYLKNLQGSQDTFDLKVKGGSLELDYIVDPPNNWETNLIINASLPSVGGYSSPTVFYKDSSWYLISGARDGNFYGYVYNSSNMWQVNTTINASLPTISSQWSFPSVFYKDSSWYIISGGGNDGKFYGYVYNSSNMWQTNLTINASLPTLSGTGVYPSVFYKDSSWYIITDNDTGLFLGFVYNNSDLKWYSNSTIISGLPSHTPGQIKPSVFYKDSSWYLLSGNSVGAFDGYVWNVPSLSWKVNTTINASLPSVGTYSEPSVFYKNSSWYLIGGADSGQFYGYDYYNPDSIPPTYYQNSTNNTAAGISTNFSINVNDNVALNPNGMYIFSINNTGANLVNDTAVNFTTTPSWANVTKVLNSTVGKVIGYKWYFNDSTGNTNSTPIYYLNTTVFSDTTPPTITFDIPPTPANASSTSSPVTISANISDASNTSSWIDFDKSLVGYLAMDYYNATGIYDNSTYNNFGTFAAGTGLNYTNLTTGARGKALKFDGVNDELDMPHIDLYNRSFSFSTWVYFNSLSTYGPLFDEISSYNKNKYLELQVRSSHLFFGFYANDFSGTATLTTGTWYYVVFTYDNSTKNRSIYLNGILDNSNISSSDFLGTTGQVNLGYSADASAYLNGSLDEVMIFNRSLSSTEVLALYDSKNNKFNTSSMNLSNGQHNYTVYAIDASGNAANSGWNYFNVTSGGADTVAPTITFDGSTPSNTSSRQSPVAISANISDVSNTSSWIDFDRSLVGYWAMDYYNSTGIYDNSTWSNFGRFNGGINYSNLTTGTRGQGLKFDGVDDKLNLSKLSGFNDVGAVTISAWIKPNNINSTYGGSTIFAKEENYDASPWSYWNFMLVSGNGLSYVRDTASSFQAYSSGGEITLGQWQHVVMVWNGSNITNSVSFYVNGVKTGYGFQQWIGTASDNGQNKYYIGDIGSGVMPFNGSIDEVIIFNRTLSQNEILALYNSQSNEFNTSSMSLANGQHNYTVYAIDQYGNANNSGWRYFNAGADTTPPTYSQNSTNNTAAGQITNFAININDDTALNPNGGYIFSTNNTGGWINNSLVLFTATPFWANVTKVLNSTGGNFVSYRWYFNDSAGNTNSTTIYNLTTTGSITCATPLSSAGQTYTLTNNVTSTGTCFTISNQNITLDCNGYWINYSTGGASGDNGIFSNQFNTTIKNCNIVDGNNTSPNTNRYGIYFQYNNNSILLNNFVNATNSTGIEFYSTNFNNLTNNRVISNFSDAFYIQSTSNSNLTNNTGRCLVGIFNTQGAGILLDTSSNNILTNNTGTSGVFRGIHIIVSSNNTLINNTGFSYNSSGIDLGSGSNNNSLINNTAISNYAGGALYFYHNSNNTIINQIALSLSTNYAIKIQGANNTLFRDCVNITGYDDDIYYSSSDISSNNTFINCSYNTNKEDITSNVNNGLIRKWYYQTYVNQTNGSALSGANVTATNSTGIIQFTTTTDGTGWIARQEVIDYNNTGGTRTFYSNYTITANKSGYTNASKTYNLTIQQNNINNYLTLGGNAVTCATPLSTAGTTYTLTSNVTSTGTCFTIAANNITLDCNGYWINYSTNGNDGNYGVYSLNQFNVTVKNCNIFDANRTAGYWSSNGIFLDGTTNSTLFNNFVNGSNSPGIYLADSSNYNNLTYNTGTTSGLSQGIRLADGSNYNTLINNTAMSGSNEATAVTGNSSFNIFINHTTRSPSGRGVFLWQASNHNTFINTNTSGDIGFGFNNASDNRIVDCTSVNGASYDIYFYNIAGNFNNTFVNCSYNINKETVQGAGSQLLRKWYYQAYSNYSNGTAAAGVNITATNTTGNIQFTATTDSTGWIPRQEIIDYNNTGTKSFYSNYTITANKSGYTNISRNNYNLTTRQNNVTDFFTLTGGADTTPPTYSQVSVNNTLSGLTTLFSISINDETALHPNGQYVFSTNNTGVWLNYSTFGNGNYWKKDLGINASLPKAGSFSSPAVFYKDSSWYLISGNSNGGFNGYAWNGTQWNANTTINASLFNDTNGCYPTVFYKDSSWYFLSGDYDGKFYGYAWNGTQWNANTTINASLSTLGYGFNSAPSVFYKDSSWYLISGNASGKFYGYTWNGTQWLTNLTINASLPSIGAYSTPSVFYKDGIWFLLSGSGNANGKFYGYTWNGTQWLTNLTINASLTNFVDYSTPSVFQKDGIWNLISGGLSGNFYGYNYSSSYNFTTTPSWANVTLILNLTVGSLVQYRWYFDDNVSNTNSTPIYNLTTTSSSDSTPPTYSQVATNNSLAGNITKFSVNVSDNIALNPNGMYIFSTNNTGVNFVNDTGVNFTSTPYQANVTKILNSTIGKVIGYKWYFNDSAGNTNSTPTYILTTSNAVSCGNSLSTPGATYYLSSNVSSPDTCFVISSDNITLDCQNYFINYSTDGTPDGEYGVEINALNVTVKNCNIADGNLASASWRPAILTYNYSTIFNNSIVTGNTSGVYIENANFVNVTRNTLRALSSAGIAIYGVSTGNVFVNNTITGEDYRAFILAESSSNNTLIGNNITGYSVGLMIDVGPTGNFIINNTITGGDNGIYIYSGSHNNTFVNNTVTATGGSGIGIEIDSSSNNTFRDCIKATGIAYDIYSSPGSINNTFVNCSYNINKEFADSGSQLIRKWYYQTYVNQTNGSALPNANVTATNTTGKIQFTTTTDSTGWIARQEIIDYNNTGGTRIFYSNYTITANKSGYTNASKTYNLTIQQNNVNDYLNLSGGLVAPVIYNVTGISPVTLTEGPGKTFIVVNFSVYDFNGASNLNNASAAINFTKSGEALRYNSSCAVKDYLGNYANYTCNVTMFWWDAAGTDWKVYANISDLDSYIAVNDTTTFTVNSLTGFVMTPSTLTFSNLPAGSTNQTPTNYLLLNNTGNTNVTNPIQINATDLVGETDHSKILWASNFSASNSTGGKIECNVTANANSMVNYTFTSISNTILPAGNYTKNDGTAQEQIYLCVRKVGIELTQQQYSTNSFGSWTIKIALVSISIRRKKKKNSKNKTNITIPTTIFSKELGALESISKYMKENLGMSYHNIAELLNRDERTIWTAYNKATEKQKEPIEVKETEIFIPISVLNNRELTILESVINYLREKDMKYSEIAKLIDRDQRNVRAIYNKTKNNI